MKSALIILLSAILWIANSAVAQWELLQIDKGGVGEDVQLVYHDGPSDAQNQVWTATMTTGIYRSTWSNDAWSDWDQHLPSKFAFGVDAIELTRNQVDYEFVLCASQGLGLWYGVDTQSEFDPNWIRPNPNDYPEEWEHAGTHDVAFYWPDGGMPGTHPEQQYYVILTNPVDDDLPGIYEWDNEDQEFERVALGQQPAGAHKYRHFYRDLSAPNVLYVFAETGLYRISGEYGEEDFDNVTPTGADSVFGFNQWKAGDVMTYYVLVSIGNSYRVYFCTDLATAADWSSSEIYTCPSDLGLNREWEELFRYSSGAGVIGRPVPQSTNHWLWLTAPSYGVWYVEVDDEGQPIEGPVQINGSGENALKRWSVRAFTPDPYHIQGDEIMRLFFGTHQCGVYYLTFTNSNPTTGYQWDNSRHGMYASSVRDVRSYHRASNPPLNQILAPTECQGLNQSDFNSISWDLVETSGTNYQTDPTFNKGCDQGAMVYNQTSSQYDYFFGSSPMIVYDGMDEDREAYCLGGLYRITSEGEVSPEIINENISDPENKGYSISNIYAPRWWQWDKVFVATGSWGAEDDPFSPIEDVTEKNVVCYYNGSGWTRIWKMIPAANQNLGILALACWQQNYSPGGLETTNPEMIWVGLGNLYDVVATSPSYGNLDYMPRVFRLKHESGVWNYELVWPPTTGFDDFDEENHFSVTDIWVGQDTWNYTYSNVDTLAWWGISAGFGSGVGNVYRRSRYQDQSPPSDPEETNYWYETKPLYSIDWMEECTLDGDSTAWRTPPACLAVKAIPPFEDGKILAVLEGYVSNSTANESDLRAYLYLHTPYRGSIQQQEPPYTKWGFVETSNWTKLGSLDPVPTVNGENVYPIVYHGRIQIAMPTVNDVPMSFLIPGDGGVFRFRNSTVYIPCGTGGSGWNWISSNCIYPTDSLRYFLGGSQNIDEFRDQFGNRARFFDDPPLDSIYVWNWLKGYGAHATAHDSLMSWGDPIPRDSLMMLYPECQAYSSNWIAYLPPDTMTCDYAFANTDCLLIVKNDQGQFWRPNRGDNAFDMLPGEGYQVGVSDTVEHRYPTAPQGQSVGPIVKVGGGCTQSLTPSHFVFTDQTIDFYPIYVEDLLINGQPPAVGDEVGCFTPDSLCVGAGAFEGEFPLKIAAWKDDPCTEPVDGYTVGQTLAFKFFDVSAGVEVPLEMTMVATQSLGGQLSRAYTEFEQGPYAEHRLQASYVLPMCYNLAQNYPNPFNPTTTIRYDLPFESNVHLDIFDLMGRKVATLVDGKQSAGFRVMYWRGTNNYGGQVASGVYFYRLKTEATHEYLGKKESYEKTRKMVMIK